MHKTSKRWAALLVATVGVVNAQAETLTWNGGPTATGVFASAENWSPQQVPRPGDTLVINDAVTFAEATFDVGEQGLTLQNTAKVVCKVAFAGAGDITIRSKTQWYDAFFQSAPCPSHTGNWHVYDGVFEPSGALGSGTVYVESGASSAQLRIGYAIFENDIQIVGYSSNPAINFSNAGKLTGMLSSDANFTIYVAWVNAGERAEVRNLAGGKVCTVNLGGHNLDFSGRVNAQIVKNGVGTLRFTGVSTATDATVTVNNGTVEFTESAEWGGSSVTANGATSVLRFSGRNLTSDDATVSVTDGAKIDLTTLAAIPHVTLGETALKSGFYLASDWADGLTGSGLLSVGSDVATWIGGAAGAWSDGANWSMGVAPKGMMIAKFTNAVDLANETFDFGDEGVCIWNLANADLIQRTMFSGTGKYYKFGAGAINYKAESSYTGGTLFADGYARVETPYTNKVFGASEGIVEFTRSADGKHPYLEFGTWNVTLPNRIRFIGATSVARMQISNNIKLTGDIEADANVYILSKWGPMWAEGGFTAPGQTLTFEERDENRGWTSYIAGAIDASLLKQGTGSLELRGQSTVETNVLTVAKGTLALTADATWTGLVVVQNGGLLKLNGNGNLSSAATLTIEAGGKVEIAKGVKIEIASLVIDGKAMPAGSSYSVLTRPDVFAGEGRVKVGQIGTFIILR
ncbi:MAG: hypothetical protein SPG40_06325 [Kiritimatiellia bacterium]|nr:hypothetical protein [Kiritimatiellia bacterium]